MGQICTKNKTIIDIYIEEAEKEYEACQARERG